MSCHANSLGCRGVSCVCAGCCGRAWRTHVDIEGCCLPGPLGGTGVSHLLLKEPPSLLERLEVGERLQRFFVQVAHEAGRAVCYTPMSARLRVGEWRVRFS